MTAEPEMADTRPSRRHNGMVVSRSARQGLPGRRHERGWSWWPWLDAHRRAAGQLILWFGLIAPLAVSEERTASAVAIDPVTAISVWRGVAPLVTLLLASAILRPQAKIMGAAEGLAVMFATLAVLSTTWSVAPVPTLLKSGVLAVTYGTVVLLVRTWRSFSEGIGQIATTAQFLVISALLGAGISPDRAFPGRAHDWADDRLFGILPEIHAVPLGALSLVAFVTAVTGIGTWKWQRYPRSRWAIGGTALIVLILTGTRTSLLLLPVVLLLLAASRGARRFLVWLLALVPAVAVLLAVPTLRNSVGGLLFRGASIQELASLHGRIPMWEIGLQAALERPILGAGYYAGHKYGAYATRFAQHFPGDSSAQSAYLDSAYIETFIDLGAVGVLVLGGIVVGGILPIMRRGFSGDDVNYRVGAILATIFFTDSFISYSLQTPSYQGELFLALILIGFRFGRKRPVAACSSLSIWPIMGQPKRQHG